MGGSLRQTLVSWVCLLCFVLSSTVLNGELVLCHHADGSTQIEWGACTPDAIGNCLTGCGDSTGSQSPKPCKDFPVKHDRQVAKTVPSPVPPPTWHPAPLVAILTPELSAGPTRAACSLLAVRGRPPDTLARLRTVV